MKNKNKLLLVSNVSADRVTHIFDAFQNKDGLDINIEHLLIKKRKNSFLAKVFDKLKLPLDLDKLNQRIINKIDEVKPDVLFIVKGNNIYPWTLKRVKQIYPNLKLISWSLDDMFALHNRSLYYRYGLKYYDIIFTSKSYNLNELRKIGAKRVEFLYQAFSKKYHNPCVDCNAIRYKANVLFIGFAEKERFSDLNYLAQNGVKIDIYGSGWDKRTFKEHHENLNINTFDLLGNDYSNTISCSKISLCFLRKVNRDLHTSRSIEIPACGGFMIAERTDEHKNLFEEDKEAIYFDNKEELLQKIRYYLEHDQLRRQIAKAGYDKTRQADYSYDDMVERVLDAI